MAVTAVIARCSGGTYSRRTSLPHPRNRNSFGCLKSATRRLRHGVPAASSSTDIPADARWETTYPRWESIHDQLVKKYGMPSISPQDAAQMIESGQAVLVDVRLSNDWEAAHPKGAFNAPAFRVIKMGQGGFSSMLKAVLMQANGVTPTEPNPDFLSQIKAAAGDDKAVILACEAGGTTDTYAGFPSGKASRSLKAAWRVLHYEAKAADQVYHLSTGVLGWYQAGLPFEGEYDPSKAYRSPNAVSSVDSASVDTNE